MLSDFVKITKMFLCCIILVLAVKVIVVHGIAPEQGKIMGNTENNKPRVNIDAQLRVEDGAAKKQKSEVDVHMINETGHTTKELATGFEKIKREAECGNAEAQYMVYMEYMKRAGDDNEIEALEWLQKSASGRYARAQCALGLRYLKGDVLPMDWELARFWLAEAVSHVGVHPEDHKVKKVAEAGLASLSASDILGSKDKGEDLLASIGRGNVTRVRRLLDANDIANYRGDDGVTPLGKVISDTKSGPNLEIMRNLLKCGANPNALWGNCGTTPFFSLVQNSTSSQSGSSVLSNQVAAVKLLLKYGADPNMKQGLFGKTSLEYVVMRNGDIELVKAIVEGGAVISDEIIECAKDNEVKGYLVEHKGNSMPVRQAVGEAQNILR